MFIAPKKLATCFDIFQNSWTSYEIIHLRQSKANLTFLTIIIQYRSELTCKEREIEIQIIIARAEIHLLSIGYFFFTQRREKV